MAKLRRDCSDKRTGVTLSVALASVLCALADPGAAATRRDPDWPCQQIKVPTISAAAVWSGPSLEGLGPWSADEEVADLVARLAARRTPLDEAQKLIDAFSEKAGAEKRSRLLLLFAGVFEELNKQREEVIGGLARVAHRQTDPPTKFAPRTMIFSSCAARRIPTLPSSRISATSSIGTRASSRIATGRSAMPARCRCSSSNESLPLRE